MVVHS